MGVFHYLRSMFGTGWSGIILLMFGYYKRKGKAFEGLTGKGDGVDMGFQPGTCLMDDECLQVTGLVFFLLKNPLVSGIMINYRLFG